MTRRVEVLMKVKPVEVESPPVSVVCSFGEESTSSGVVLVKIVVLARKMNLEVDSVFGPELLDFHNRELTIDELIEMHEQEQDTEDLQSLDPQFNQKIE
ncbi:hypothetical protein TNCV_2015031 [Trichonephila clavipes]|nr:hypothetical protein TNCV_2015031 [Trichonephila clavipes]